MLVSADVCAISSASSSATRAASACSDPAVALSSSDAKSASSLLCCACASLPCVSRGLVAIKTAVRIKCKGQRWTFRSRWLLSYLLLNCLLQLLHPALSGVKQLHCPAQRQHLKWTTRVHMQLLVAPYGWWCFVSSAPTSMHAGRSAHFLAWAWSSCLSALHLSGVTSTRINSSARSFSSWAQRSCNEL